MRECEFSRNVNKFNLNEQVGMVQVGQELWPEEVNIENLSNCEFYCGNVGIVSTSSTIATPSVNNFKIYRDEGSKMAERRGRLAK